MSGERLALGAAGAVVLLGVLALLTETSVQIHSRLSTSYDIEMSRYARELKLPSPNPSIGHVHRPNRRARLMNVEVETNSDGLRDREYDLERNGRRRIVFLGDSLTLGWGVEASRTFEAILEGSDRGTEILNFGIGNYNTAQEVSLFEEKGLKYVPDAVVVFFFINDAEPTPHISRWEWLGASRGVTFLWSNLKTVQSRWLAGRSFADYYAALYDDEQPGWIAERQSFLELKRLCAERSIDLKVVMLPELHQLNPYLFAAQHAKLAAFLRDNAIPHLDLAPAFRAVGDPLALWVALDDAHPNATAHALIARAARGFILGSDHAPPATN